MLTKKEENFERETNKFENSVLGLEGYWVWRGTMWPGLDRGAQVDRSVTTHKRNFCTR